MIETNQNLIEYIELKSGEPCHHIGCRAHITHPCEIFL